VRISIPTRYADTIRSWRSTPPVRAAGIENEDENEALWDSCDLWGHSLVPFGFALGGWPPSKRDQSSAANFACFLVGLGCGEPEGRDCGLGVGLLFGLFMAIN
jgi:hypothetical protein